MLDMNAIILEMFKYRVYCEQWEMECTLLGFLIELNNILGRPLSGGEGMILQALWDDEYKLDELPIGDAA